MISVPEHTVSRSASETQEIGRKVGSELQNQTLVLLRGDLGAGKSVFAHGIAQGLGIEAWRGSPTFTLINEYDGPTFLYHADLYRLGEHDLPDLGLEEYAHSHAVLVIEWPERAPGYLAGLDVKTVIDVEIVYADEQTRNISVARMSG